jgi:hypothetical protein
MVKLVLNIHMNATETARQNIVDYIQSFLGGSMVDVELDPKDFNFAIDRALAKYRQRSSNAVEESYGFLDLQLDTNEYIMPKEVVSIRQLFRRSIGSRTGGGDGGSLFEPFNLAYSNTYLLASTNMGGLATYYAFAGYQKQVGKMFGSDINFVYNSTNHTLTVQQRPYAQEQLLVWMYNYRPDFNLLDDVYAGQWLKDYALANAKMILGQAREKFPAIAGPQGGSALNGATLKNEAKAEMDQLELDLINYKEGSTPLTWIQG